MKTAILVQENVALAPLTTLKIGGNARFFVRAETEFDVAAAFDFAAENDFELFVLGGGSNVLIADEGFDGLVLQIALKGIEVKENFVTAQAGEDWDEFVRLCVENDLQGVECLSGIPGCTGGTPVQNVGAYGQEVSETIVRVRVFDRKSKEILELSNVDCQFSYRASLFNTTAKNRFIVLSVTFALTKNGAPKIAYKDLHLHFGDRQPSLNEMREAVLAIRRRKSMVIDDGDPNARSAGSFFKNPVVPREKFSEIADVAAKFGVETVPSFEVDKKAVKIPAAWLIENAGFRKGYIKNGAGISTRHTLALINRNGATAREIIALKDEIQTKVKEKFGVELAPEPVFVGF
ncbi:MAG TPA: UDP-N-acetylmuramate dehydrogenase [Pyrinomonadaceae bacterium]